MRAIVVNEPGGPDVLEIEHRDVYEARDGWVLVRVRAFGINRSEIGTRRGDSGAAVKFPRVLGIECAGEVVADPSGVLDEGQRVVAVMGGMGREFDGGYQEYALLPAASVFPVQTELAWGTLGAIPETFATAYGSLVRKLGLASGETLLIRGASSSVGMAAIAIADDLGARVIATTRQEAKAPTLEAQGADRVVIDAGEVAAAVRETEADGVDCLLELVGPRTMPESLAAVREGGRACIAGFLEEVWEVEAAEAAAAEAGVEYMRFGSIEVVRDDYREAMQELVSGVEHGRLRDGIDRRFGFEEIRDAHRRMESNQACGKLVVLTDP